MVLREKRGKKKVSLCHSFSPTSTTLCEDVGYPAFQKESSKHVTPSCFNGFRPSWADHAIIKVKKSG